MSVSFTRFVGAVFYRSAHAAPHPPAPPAQRTGHPPLAGVPAGVDRRAFLRLFGTAVGTTAMLGSGVLLAGCHSADEPTVLQRDPEIMEMPGVNGGVSREFRRVVLETFARLPTSIQRVLADNHYRIWLSPTVKEHLDSASGSASATHTPGHIIAGEYWLTDQGHRKRVPDIPTALRHEIGHAIDWHFRYTRSDGEEVRVSNSAPFWDALTTDLRQLSAAEQNTARQLLEAHGYSGVLLHIDILDDHEYRNREVFAILFTELIAGNATEPLYQLLPRTTRFVYAHGVQRPALETRLPNLVPAPVRPT